jgi:hypothetical protein
MVFYETPIFIDQVTHLLDDESYRKLQNQLVRDPESGDLVPRSGGLRKIRWLAAGQGKRGGLRVIYYLQSQERIYLLFAYPKNAQENLTPQQTQKLRQLIEQTLLP